jgi:hypothetical protein
MIASIVLTIQNISINHVTNFNDEIACQSKIVRKKIYRVPQSRNLTQVVGFFRSEMTTNNLKKAHFLIRCMNFT